MHKCVRRISDFCSINDRIFMWLNLNNWTFIWLCVYLVVSPNFTSQFCGQPKINEYMIRLECTAHWIFKSLLKWLLKFNHQNNNNHDLNVYYISHITLFHRWNFSCLLLLWLLHFSPGLIQEKKNNSCHQHQTYHIEWSAHTQIQSYDMIVFIAVNFQHTHSHIIRKPYH